ncbi:replication factor C small subunit [Candidatus Pacearchaeota archaeon]|nr:replication factor C small subunit [Candidatus Pacearchaeota archaeon]
MAKESFEKEIDIWTEKYRPRDFEDVVGQKEIVKRVKAFVESKNMPHLMFAGPAGTGKSSVALITAKKLFGDKWRENFLELNASDERGIDVVRQKVKDFARTKAFSGPFKIIFLDESDALTREAQQALRRTMENFTGTCRFILSCNYPSRIIDPIQSRCAIFRFTSLSEKDIEDIIKNIANKESLKVDSKAVKALYEVSGGDCRRVINLLQASASISDAITDETIYQIVSAANPQNIKEILEKAIAGKFIDAREKLLDVMLKQSVSGLDVIKAVQREVWNLSISDDLKVRLTEKIGEAEFRITEGSDEFIQLEAFLASLVLFGKK